MSYHWDGFVMDVQTMDEALDIIDRFRPVAIEMLHSWNASLLATKAARLIDTAHARTKPAPRMPLAEVYDEVFERRLKIVRQETRDPCVDPDFRLTLFRFQNRIYGLIATEQAEWREAWLSLAEVGDFSWWNGTDGPDEIDPDEWERRGDVWKSIMPDSWPAGHGVVVYLTPRYFESGLDDIIAAIPCMSQRKRFVAADLAVHDRVGHLLPGEDHDVHALISASMSASSWITTTEGEAEVSRIESHLDLPEITGAVLTGRPDCTSSIEEEK